MATPIIELKNVSKTYNRAGEKVRILDKLFFTANQGDFIALMGPSGSGKTTLLNIIAGLDKADKEESSTVIVAGKDLTKLGESQLTTWRAKNVGFIFQFYNLIPVLSALENVLLPLTLFEMTKIERSKRASFALEVVGLQDRLHHLPSQLSGGQEQRVAIARALVTDPVFLVADEPTGDLDRKSAEEIMTILASLNQQFNKTIMMVTHDSVTAKYASRVVKMDKGQLLNSSL